MNININITPRHNIGDKVYVVSHYYDYYPQQEAYTIKNVIVNIDNDGIRIRYEVENENIADCVPEEWVHSTYAECKKWCDEHNC